MIQITENYGLSADDMCYTVHKISNGKIDRNHPHYFTSMKQAVAFVIQQQARDGVADSSITTLHQFAEELERITNEVKATIDRVDDGQGG